MRNKIFFNQEYISWECKEKSQTDTGEKQNC